MLFTNANNKLSQNGQRFGTKKNLLQLIQIELI